MKDYILNHKAKIGSQKESKMDELEKAIENLKKQLSKMSKKDLFNLFMYIEKDEIIEAIADVYNDKIGVNHE